jgi:hypothetical protein
VSHSNAQHLPAASHPRNPTRPSQLGQLQFRVPTKQEERGSSLCCADTLRADRTPQPFSGLPAPPPRIVCPSNCSRSAPRPPAVIWRDKPTTSLAAKLGSHRPWTVSLQPGAPLARTARLSFGLCPFFASTAPFTEHGPAHPRPLTEEAFLFLFLDSDGCAYMFGMVHVKRHG